MSLLTTFDIISLNFFLCPFHIPMRLGLPCFIFKEPPFTHHDGVHLEGSAMRPQLPWSELPMVWKTNPGTLSIILNRNVPDSPENDVQLCGHLKNPVIPVGFITFWTDRIPFSFYDWSIEYIYMYKLTMGILKPILVQRKGTTFHGQF